MRIASIQSVNYYPKTNVTNTIKNDNNMSVSVLRGGMQTLPNYGYGRDLVNRKQPAFTSSISKAAVELAQQLPFEERLASLFEVLHHNEIIVAGKDFNSAQKALKKHLGKLKQVIQKEIFIPENKLEHNYAFIKNLDGDIELLNINDKNVTYITGGKTYHLDPGNSFYIVNNDTIQYANDVIHLKEKPKADLSFSRPIFSKVYDFTDEVQNEVVKLNNKTVARGYILYGPPGTGKTELCRALANEANMEYMYASGTDFESKWYGEAEANIRAWFDELKNKQPAIGVIDEIDSIGKERMDAQYAGDSVVNQILTCMTDLYNENDDVFIIGLTNKYSSLDSALKRAERFSKHIYMGPPDLDGVKEILKIHTKKKKLDENVNFEELSKKLFENKAVGSDIKFVTKLARENMMNRLGLYEKMENGTFVESDMLEAKINQEDFLNAIESFKEQHRTSTQRKPIGFNK